MLPASNGMQRDGRRPNASQRQCAMAFVEEEAELPQLTPQQQHAMQMAMQRSAASMPDDDEYADFLKRVEDVGATIKGLKDGTVDVSQLDAKEAKAKKEEADRQARRDAKKREAEEKAAASREAARKHEELKEANREKIEELKQDYYLRKAKRERWEAFRAENKSRGNTNDYYRGWDLFEDDPDEELFSGDNPAAVQDQAAFDAMAKDVEERTARRKADKAAGAKEKEAGNAAFKEGQHTEAIARYSCSLEHFKGDKAALALDLALALAITLALSLALSLALLLAQARSGRDLRAAQVHAAARRHLQSPHLWRRRGRRRCRRR